MAGVRSLGHSSKYIYKKIYHEASVIFPEGIT